VNQRTEFIPDSGACLTTTNVLEGRGQVRWIERKPSQGSADNGWRILSDIDTSDYLEDPDNWKLVAFNQVCGIEPALISIYDFALGSRLELVRGPQGLKWIDSKTGRPIREKDFYVPEQHRSRWSLLRRRS
jgi:hypothetical protein